MSQLVVTNADKAEWEEIKNVNITIPTDPNPELQNEVKQIYVADKNGNNKIGIWDKYLQYDADGVVSEKTDIDKNEIEEFSMLTNYFGNSSKRLKQHICQNCQNLNKITINNNNDANNPLILEDGVFNGCKKAASLIINCPVSSATTNAKFAQMPQLLTPVGSGSTVSTVTTYFNLKTDRNDLDYTVTAYSPANGSPFEGTKTGNIMTDSVYNNGIMVTLKNVATSANISSGTQPYIKNLQVMPHNTDKKETHYIIDPCKYYYQYKCSNCGKYMGESSIYTDHNWSDYSTEIDIANSQKIHTRTCYDCNESDTTTETILIKVSSSGNTKRVYGTLGSYNYYEVTLSGGTQYVRLNGTVTYTLSYSGADPTVLIPQNHGAHPMLVLTCNGETVNLLEDERVTCWGFNGLVSPYGSTVIELPVITKIQLNVGTDPDVSYIVSLS